MMTDVQIAIDIEKLCIAYQPMQDVSIVKNMFHNRLKRDKKIRALTDISFTVHKGEVLGVVGKNGSGKSTLLKALAGIFRPDGGRIDLCGNTISLMSIGVGFNDQISGRENIILSGMLLGFSESEMYEKMEDIIDFAEIGEFIDMPVRVYSSGMHSKLAFAITASLETDILLVDEVLSVGDEKFRKKSLSRMQRLIGDRDRTVLLVSHDMTTVKEICNRVLWLHDGQMKRIGDTEGVLEEYKEFML